MKRTVILALGTALCTAPLVLPAALMAQTKAPAPPAAAPKAAVKAAAYKAPRNAFGQPNLSGAWTNASITAEQRPANVNGRAVYTPQEVADLEGFIVKEVEAGNKVSDPTKGAPTKGGDPIPDGIRTSLYLGGGGNTGGYDRGWLDPGSAVMRVHGEPRTSFLTTPDGRVPPRKGQAAAPAGGRGGGGGGGGRGGQAPQQQAAAGRGGIIPQTGGATRGAGGGGATENPEQRSLGDRCILSFGRNAGPPMLNNGFYNNNYNLVQGKDTVAIWVEMVHDVRIVRMNSKHRTDGIRPYYGDAIGHYEGDTLVVETTNIPQSQAYNGSWQTLTVTEKFTRVTPTRMLYQYSIHDPSLWDADWGGEYEFLMLPTGQRVEEYACHEGNYALEDILAGARAEERASGTAAQR